MPIESSSFQFHKGTIKTDGSTAGIAGKGVFQFHKGTIKTYIFRGSCVYFWVFQFHKGTIKTYEDIKEAAIKLNFNSIKVRLKRPFYRSYALAAVISIP